MICKKLWLLSVPVSWCCCLLGNRGSRRLRSSTAKGAKLFSTFDDPLAAKSLDIVEFDESNASIKPLSIAQRMDYGRFPRIRTIRPTLATTWPKRPIA